VRERTYAGRRGAHSASMKALTTLQVPEAGRDDASYGFLTGLKHALALLTKRGQTLH
jgi:hypothetical protein